MNNEQAAALTCSVCGCAIHNFEPWPDSCIAALKARIAEVERDRDAAREDKERLRKALEPLADMFVVAVEAERGNSVIKDDALVTLEMPERWWRGFVDTVYLLHPLNCTCESDPLGRCVAHLSAIDKARGGAA